MRRKSMATLLTVVAVFTLATVAWATQPVQVSTTMRLEIHPPDFTTGSGTYDSFMSSEGVEIPGGTFEDSAFAAGSTVHVTRILRPDDGSETIEVRFMAFVETGVGKWVVVSGTGPYAGLHGRGTSQVVSFDQETLEVVESWVGTIHFDPAQS